MGLRGPRQWYCRGRDGTLGGTILNLKHFVMGAAAAGATILTAAGANATVVTFDDLVGSGSLTTYAGINWAPGSWNFYDSVQPPYNPASNFERVYDFTSNGEFDFSGPVVFNGASFAGYASATVQFQLSLGGSVVWTSGTLAPSGTPTFLASGYSGLVDKVEVLSPQPDFFVMDNVTYNGGAVPEPATWALMLGGFGLAGVTLRRRRAVAVAA